MSWIGPAILTFLGIATLVVLHELGHFAAAKAVGMRVEKFSLFFGKFIWSVKRGETEYGIAAIPLGGYVKITGMNPTEAIPAEVAHRAYYRQPVWKRIVVIAAGPAVNLVLAFLILWGFFTFKPVDDTSKPPSTIVGAVGEKSPAAGLLQVDDRLVAVDGKRGDFEVLRRQIATHTCEGAQREGCKAATPAVLTIVRDGREQTVRVSPEFSAKEKRPLIGFSFAPQTKDLNVGQAASTSLDRMWLVTSETVKTVVGLAYSAERRDQIGSVVGGYEATRRTFEFDAAQAVAILGLISLSLAVINLFPFLPLDGGHIFWALAEKVRRRPIPFATMEKASVIGFVLVMIVFFIGLTNDIERLGDGTFDRLR